MCVWVWVGAFLVYLYNIGRKKERNTHIILNDKR